MQHFFLRFAVTLLLAIFLERPSAQAAGVITYTTGASNNRLMRINAAPGATPFNISAALNPMAVAAGRDFGPITVAADGGWYVFQSERFDTDIGGFAALTIVSSTHSPP